MEQAFGFGAVLFAEVYAEPEVFQLDCDSIGVKGSGVEALTNCTSS